MNEHRIVEVEVPCTCGELVQGYRDGEPFLVSCPINRYSQVAVALEADLFPPAAPKASTAAAATLEALGHGARPHSVRVSNSLPPSRGFGTSTADVAGIVVATAAALGVRLDPSEVARIAVSIEPSDGTMFPGLVAFNHRSGTRALSLGAAPPLLVAVLEFEGTVDTLEFNSKLDLKYLCSREAEHAEALRLLRLGLREGNWEMVGRAATYSARLNQSIIEKPELEAVIGLAEEHRALGVCAAHSGTVLGALFQREDAQRAETLVRLAPSRLSGLERTWLTRMVDGGAKLISSPSAVPLTGGQFTNLEDRWISIR